MYGLKPVPFKLTHYRRSSLPHCCQYCVCKLAGSGSATYVAGQGLVLGVHRFHGLLHLVCRGGLVNVAQHEHGRLQQRGGIRHIFACDVGRGAVYRFEDGALHAQVCSRNQAQAAHEAGAEVADDVAVEIFKQQRVVLEGIHDQLHASVVDEVLAVENIREPLGHLAGTAQKKPVGELHDIGFVDGVNLFATVLARVFEGELGDARGAFLADNLDALDDAGNYLVLQSHVLALGVFADDDQVDAGPVGGQAGEILDGPEVGKEIELFAERNIDAFEAAADRRGHGAFERDAVALDGLVKGGGDVFAMNLEGFSAGCEALPVELDAGGFKDADNRMRDFGADAVAGDQSNFVRLGFYHLGLRSFLACCCWLLPRPYGAQLLIGWHSQHSVRRGGLHAGLVSLAPFGSGELQTTAASFSCSQSTPISCFEFHASLRSNGSRAIIFLPCRRGC